MAILVEAATAEEVVAVVAGVGMVLDVIVVFPAEGMQVAWKLYAVPQHRAAEPAGGEDAVAEVVVVAHN